MRPLYGDAKDIQARAERAEELARHAHAMEDKQEPPESSCAKPQRRTLVKVMRELVNCVNDSVFHGLDGTEIQQRYRVLLLATNEAERVLDRERQHSRIKKSVNSQSEGVG